MKGHISIPGSKNMSYSAIFLASLADGVSEIGNILIDDEIRGFISGLKQLGIAIQLDERTHSCIIAGGNGRLPQKHANLREEQCTQGTSLILAACANTQGVYFIDSTPNQPNADISSLIDILAQQGAQMIPNDARQLPVTILGTDVLKGGDIALNQHIKAETASALLMIAPYAKSTTTLTTPHLLHQAQLETTCALMTTFGVLAHHIHDGQFTIPSPQRYHARDLMIEPDFSIAAFYLAAAAITNSEITLCGIKPQPSKRDEIKFLNILERMGCQIHDTPEGVHLISNENLNGIEVNMRNFSNYFFALAAVAPFASSPTTITHLGDLHQDELAAMKLIQSEWSKLGIEVEMGDNWIKISPLTLSETQGGGSRAVSAHTNEFAALALNVIGRRLHGLDISNGHHSSIRLDS